MSAFDAGSIYPGWEIVSTIGHGGFGSVYEIQRNNFGHIEKAALKVISIPQNKNDIDEMRNDGFDDVSITARFEGYLRDIVREYSLMTDIKGHANAVYCDDVKYIQHDDGLGWDIFIKMELLTPLTKALGKELVIPDEQVIKIGQDISNMLDYCEKKKIIHRDIKPQNIFVSDGGTYKLGDFGIAKTTERTTSGTKTGTYKYMAPEVYNNKPYGTKADIYSLGLTLYWLLNKRRSPFLPLPPAVPTASDEDEARKRRFDGEQIPEPAYGSEDLKKVVLRATAFDPDDRYQHASEMYSDLENIKNGKPLSPATLLFAEKLVNGDSPQHDDDDADNTPSFFVKSKEKLHKSEESATDRHEVAVTGVSLSQNSVSLHTGEAVHLTAAVTPPDAANQSVSWSSDNPSVADVDADGNVTAKEAGTAIITVKTVDGEKTAACEATVTAVVPAVGKKKRLPVIIAVAAVALIGVGVILSLLVKGNKKPESGQTTIETEVRNVPDITGKTKAEAVAALEALGFVAEINEECNDSVEEDLVIRQDPEGQTGLKPGSKVTVTVSLGKENNRVKSVSIDQKVLSLVEGTSAQLVASVDPEDASDTSVSWTSDNMSVATVDSNGNVTAKSAGTATITVKTADGGKTATCKVTVTTDTVSVTGVTLSSSTLSLAEGKTATLTATVSPTSASNQSVSWSSSNTSVATVNSSGTVTAKSAGTATITVKTADGGKTATCKVTVTADTVSVTGVTLSSSTLSLVEGKTATLTATVSPTNASNQSVSWSSDNTSVATVNSSGTITAKSVGTATITVETADGGKTATCKVTVTADTVSVTGVTLSSSTLSLVEGKTAILTATVSPTNASNQSVSWSSDNTSVATVNSSGKVTAKSAGTATITVETADGGKTATCKVTVTADTVSVTGVTLSSSTLSLEAGTTATLTATVSPSNASDQSVSWSSSNTSVATVDSSGTVTAKSVGTATITVKTADGGRTATCTVTVWATATYSIQYVSSNGTNLGSSSATYDVGTTNTIYAPDITGYVTPAAQTVAWDSTSAKTIVFTYTPTDHENATASGNLWIKSGSTGVHYSCVIETRNRTADSVEFRVTCTNTKDAGCYYGYTQKFEVKCGSASTGEITICDNTKMNYTTTSRSVSASKSSGWVKVTGLGATDTTITLNGKVYSSDDKTTFKKVINIPAY